MAGVGLPVRAESRLASGIARLVLRTPPDWAACLAVCLAALGFDLYRLGDPAIWLDEAFSLHVARLPAPAMWTAVLSGEPNMNLYFLVLYGWTQFLTALGVTVTEFLARFPSAVFAALSSAMVFLLGRRFLGMTAGIVGAAFFLLNSTQLAAAQDARAYSLLLALICTSWYAWFTLLAKGSSRWWWPCYVVTSALAVWAHLLGLLILLAQVIAFAGLLLLPGPWRDTARSRLRGMAVSLIAIAGLVAPHIYAAQHHSSQTGWVPIPHFRDILHLYVVYLDNASGLSFRLVAIAFGAGLLMFALSRLPWGSRLFSHIPGGRPFALLASGPGRQIVPAAGALVSWLAVPVLAAYLVSQGSLRLFSIRYMIVVLPALCLLVGLGVALVRWPPAQVVMTMALLVSAVIAIPQYYAHAQVEDLRTPTRWVVQHYQPGDGLVCHFSGAGPGCQDWIFEYYLYDLHAGGIATDVAPQSPASAAWADLAAYAARHPRLFFLAGDFGTATDVAQAQATQRWLDSRYRLIAQLDSPGSIARLYATGAPSASDVSPWAYHSQPCEHRQSASSRQRSVIGDVAGTFARYVKTMHTPVASGRGFYESCFQRANHPTSGLKTGE